MAIQTITTAELHERMKSGKPTKVVDVRTPAEYQQVHATGAINFPLDKLDGKQFVARGSAEDTEPIYMICKMGGRSQKACELLAAAGQTNVINVVGGTDAWVKAGFPVERDETAKPKMSIERQVRILAGLIVLVGSLLAGFVNNWFAIIPGFIGAGLAFAGLTNSCGMGMMLMKAPWNR